MGLFDIWIMDCLHIAAVTILPALVLSLSGAGAAIYKYGWQAAGQFIYRMPFKIFGYASLIYQQKITVTVAFLTAFSGSIRQAAGVRGFNDIPGLLKVFGGELLNKVLGASQQFLQGLQSLQKFLGLNNVCSHLTSLDLLVEALRHFWVGASSIIVLLFLYSLYRGRWQKAEVDKHEQTLVLALILMGSALVHAGWESTVLGELVDRLVDVLDTLSQSTPQPGNNTTKVFKESLNQSQTTK